MPRGPKGEMRPAAAIGNAVMIAKQGGAPSHIPATKSPHPAALLLRTSAA